MAWSDFWGKPAQNVQAPIYKPHQEQLLDKLLGMGSQGLQGLNFDFAPIEQKARSDFNTKTVPGIAERYGAFLQGNGRLDSSGFRDALSSASTGLDESLASMKAQHQFQQGDFYRNLLGMGLTPRFANEKTEGSTGLAGDLLGAGGAAATGFLAGGPAGAGIAGIASLLGSLLKNRQQGSSMRDQTRSDLQNAYAPTNTGGTAQGFANPSFSSQSSYQAPSGISNLYDLQRFKIGGGLN